MITKEQAQEHIQLLDAVSRGGLPINSLIPIAKVAQDLQNHVDQLSEEAKRAEEEAKKAAEEAEKKLKKTPEAE